LVMGLGWGEGEKCNRRERKGGGVSLVVCLAEPAEADRQLQQQIEGDMITQGTQKYNSISNLNENPRLFVTERGQGVQIGRTWGWVAGVRSRGRDVHLGTS
jgi:hypothetical protein